MTHDSIADHRDLPITTSNTNINDCHATRKHLLPDHNHLLRELALHYGEQFMLVCNGTSDHAQLYLKSITCKNKFT